MNVRRATRAESAISLPHQRGHVALLLSLSIVVAVSVVGVGVVEIAMADTRRIAHEARRLEAHAAAESALDRAALLLRLNARRIRGTEPGAWMEPGRERWSVCADTASDPPCSAGADNVDRESFDSHWSAYGPLPLLFSPGEPGALMSTAHYVARAERAGEAMPGWSTVHVIAEGRSRDGTGMARLRRSYQLRPLIGRVPDAPVVNTQGDALRFLFGVSAADLDELRAASEPLDDCASLAPASRGLIWVRGDCVLPTVGAIGSANAPVILAVEGGAVRVEAPLDFFGILLLHAVPAGTTPLQSSEPSTLHGALVADGDLEVLPDGLSIRYDPDILQRLSRLGGRLSEVPGSWTDHR
ncbi:MAG: hypothetical protein ACREUE_17265 [Panacagrimonas sp.]